MFVVVVNSDADFSCPYIWYTIRMNIIYCFHCCFPSEVQAPNDAEPASASLLDGVYLVQDLDVVLPCLLTSTSWYHCVCNSVNGTVQTTWIRRLIRLVRCGSVNLSKYAKGTGGVQRSLEMLGPISCWIVLRNDQKGGFDRIKVRKVWTWHAQANKWCQCQCHRHQHVPRLYCKESWKVRVTNYEKLNTLTTHYNVIWKCIPCKVIMCNPLWVPDLRGSHHVLNS